MLDKRATRIAIAKCYRTKFTLKPTALWHLIEGYDGTILGIMNAIPQIPDGSRDVVWRVLVCIQECLRIKVQYRGERRSSSGGHNKLIEMYSIKAKIIADDLEDGLLVNHANAHVNEHRAECYLPKTHVGMITVSRYVLLPATLHHN